MVITRGIIENNESYSEYHRLRVTNGWLEGTDSFAAVAEVNAFYGYFTRRGGMDRRFTISASYSECV